MTCLLWFGVLAPLAVVLLGYWCGTPDDDVVHEPGDSESETHRKNMRLMDNRKRLRRIRDLSDFWHYAFGLPVDGVEYIYADYTGRKPSRVIKRRLAWGVIIVQVASSGLCFTL